MQAPPLSHGSPATIAAMHLSLKRPINSFSRRETATENGISNILHLAVTVFEAVSVWRFNPRGEPFRLFSGVRSTLHAMTLPSYGTCGLILKSLSRI